MRRSVFDSKPPHRDFELEADCDDEQCVRYVTATRGRYMSCLRRRPCPRRRSIRSTGSTCPTVDVAKAGGGRTIETRERSYRQADPATTLRVIQNEADDGASDGRSDGSSDGESGTGGPTSDSVSA